MGYVRDDKHSMFKTFNGERYLHLSYGFFIKQKRSDFFGRLILNIKRRTKYRSENMQYIHLIRLVNKRQQQRQQSGFVFDTEESDQT